MEYTTEIINISKIKEGFFIGDKTAGTNLDVVIQFKISHMINTAGSQILNQFETIGIEYLSLNWQENSAQKLFDLKDEIPNKIVSFIDNGIENGEGVLAYSVKGENRNCILVIIYFMKKYNWSLKKCVEFLKSKRKNINIPEYFLGQLREYETRIKNKISKEWYNLNNIRDNEEYLIRNTYLNSLIKENKKINIFNTNIYKYNSRPHVSWGDNNPYYKYNSLIINNNKKDLILQKNIKDVVSHLRLLPKKKNLKISHQYSFENKNNNSLNIYYLNESYNNLNNNFQDNKSEINNLSNFKLNKKIVNKLTQLTNNFNNLNLPKQKSNSLGKNNKKTLDFKKHLNKDENSNKKYLTEDENSNNEINYIFQINNKYNYINNFIKINNYFDIPESKKKNISNKRKNKIQKIKNNKFNNNDDYINNLEISKQSLFNNNHNYMNKSSNINQYIITDIKNPEKLRDINNNQKNYLFQNNISINNISFSKNKEQNNSFFEKKMFSSQQNFKKVKNQIIKQNPSKMNNSANNFYNNNNNKQKLNEYYNVMGQSFNNHNFIKNKQINKEDKIKKYNHFNNNHNKIINSILNENINPNFNKINNNIKKNTKNNDNSFINKKSKRSSTPNNLLPKKYLEKNQISEPNYFEYSNENKNAFNFKANNNKIRQNSNKSFSLIPRNQCK